MYIGITAVKPLEEYRLLVTFENGERRVFDVAPYLDQGVFRELKSPNVFRSVRVSFDAIEWPNGADLCPETVYAESQVYTETEAVTT